MRGGYFRLKNLTHRNSQTLAALLIHAIATLSWTKKMPEKKLSLRNEKFKANRASVTEDRGKEAVYRMQKDRAKRRNKKYKRKRKGRQKQKTM